MVTVFCKTSPHRGRAVRALFQVQDNTKSEAVAPDTGVVVVAIRHPAIDRIAMPTATSENTISAADRSLRAVVGAYIIII